MLIGINKKEFPPNVEQDRTLNIITDGFTNHLNNLIKQRLEDIPNGIEMAETIISLQKKLIKSKRIIKSLWKNRK